MPPRVVDGRFELVARLGGGGMGTVWHARDLALHRDVALKEVRPPDPDLAEYDPEGAATLRARVLREAQALARVDHPNVVTIHHIVDGGAGTYPWLVMELVTGGSLQDRLDRGPLPPGEAAELGRELLSALRAAHATGIEHRDVKPANVLLRPDGRPVLTDFGIAAIRESTRLTATGSVIGSPDYMAPERVSGRDVGAASDLWSLGMMLYVAVEGHHPLRRENTLATLAAVLSDPLPPPRRAGPLTPALTALLVRDPGARPDAATLDGMLERATVDVAARAEPEPEDARVPTSYRLAPPSAPTPPTPPTPPPPPSRPSRFRVAVLGVGLLLSVAVPAGLLAWNMSTEPEKPPTTERGTGSGSGSAAARPEQAAEKTLLTPTAIRTAVRKLKPVMGGTRVTGFTVHEEHVSAEALVKGSTKRYDRFSYRGGDVATREGPGGTVMSGNTPVDLRTYDWDAVPKLLKRAERELGVAKPTSRYLVVTPPSKTFDTGPSMSLYLSDDYGSGYLKATPRGEVIDTYPREK
ncbi:serine/threonine-protein kinase [Streptomyces sp. NPDC048172]|uniref:serine/threonine-protein kinase n=1 Tax=Streptomyces sp. NPDC048172 TaxID=3365505 RepID=UPI003722249B